MIVSCAPSVITMGGEVKVLLSNGRVETYTRGVKAVELMLDNPRQFVCDLDSLKVSQRISGVGADEELERHRMYILLPIDMLYSVLTDEEMGFLSYRASKAMKHGGVSNNLGKIFPVLCEFCLFPSDIKTLDYSSSDIEPSKRYIKQRSWRPALDTITES
ncbi:hypothetical protein GIB67_024946 [Kingdonia uniflora]|uniref:Uncharacterized protein n=1 Tax=Kingdonia uniflora TaxID=39325 RepID=A0A7J7NZG3_9MAGN|nr:hypothetical protein GIB67_024946 [Kingdonia uniflora]